MPTEPYLYLVAVSLIASIGAALSTAEWISCRHQLRDEGLFSWQVIGSRPLTVGQGFVAVGLNRLLAFRPFMGVLALRLGVLVCYPIAVWLNHGALVAASIIILSSFLMHLRSPFGMDGSDQMNLQVFGALLLGHLDGSLLVYEACLWFIAAQACLSYFTSGLAKAVSPHWQSENVLFGIFNTRTYGYEPVARILLTWPRIEKALRRGAVMMECLFPVALLVGFPGCLVFIAWGLAFHAMNAVVMGLNSFFWSFAATYPAVIYCAVGIAAFVHSRFAEAGL